MRPRNQPTLNCQLSGDGEWDPQRLGVYTLCISIADPSEGCLPVGMHNPLIHIRLLGRVNMREINMVQRERMAL